MSSILICGYNMKNTINFNSIKFDLKIIILNKVKYNMLIPPRCYTCGEVLADKWIAYVSAIQTDKNKSEEKISSEKELLELKFIDVTDKNPEKSIEGKVLDELNLHKYCCRRMMLGNVHIISYLS